jgi:predicted acylesterase/phospholipase RssA
MTLKEAEQEAWHIVYGKEATVSRVLELERALRGERKFGLARKMLQRIADTDESLLGDRATRLIVAQKLALCTYKDMDLPADQKLQDALKILLKEENLATTRDQETLGLAGAIHKRMWELSAQQHDLETSLAYYYRGCEVGIGDYGYTAINAAFVMDLLADIESATAQPAAIAAAVEQRRQLAREIRERLVRELPPLENAMGTMWWFLVTVGEAYFGLDDWDNADVWLTKARNVPGVPDWEQESTARQLATLLTIKQNVAWRIGSPVDKGASGVLLKFLGDNDAALDSVARGKVGLALSGGGFRASLYHIGVLAKLAELDLLRHVEYLSCVSGGSIVGAHFYLEVRKLLQGKLDKQIDREDYIGIVRRLEKDFYEGVRTNIRTRIAAEWLTNMKMIFWPGYSRTMRAGELYEKMIYSRVKDGQGDQPRWLNKLKIQPKGEKDEFSPKDNNWRRSAKVPILVLNATTLNTGHNWQFTATWMGEPPGGIDTEVDANYRLRRMYYTEAPKKHRDVRLGHAVGASASVPGLFEPLALLDLYERQPPEGKARVRPIVRLVDGGVYDNQGVSALLEQGCSVLLVSDASGQMAELDFPASGMLGVPLRTNSVLQSRVRVSQFEQLDSRRRGGLLKGLMFVHLKKDLEITPVDWLESKEPSPPPKPRTLTAYGVLPSVQRQLAAIRTDLDSFSESEAYALMTSGYLMTGHALAQGKPLGFEVPPPAEQVSWDFLAIAPRMSENDEAVPLLRQLGVANALVFKVWFLVRRLQLLAGLFAVALVCLLIYAAIAWWSNVIARPTVGDVFVVLLAMALSLLGFGMVAKLVNYRKTANEILIGFGMATFGFLAARLHLHVFDKLFLWQGSLKVLKRWK